MLRLLGPIFLLPALWWSGAAEAKVMTFYDIYTADVPQGWTVTMTDENFTILTSPDKMAVFLITHGMSMPKHREKVADLVKKHDALRIGSPDRMATLMRVKDKRVAVTILGDHPDRVNLYRSIQAVPGDKMREQWRSN
ncbi:MAG: hypothetical protein FWG97_05005 [Deltaproteobacteria bacterium]|nr:hypothetical protein [Deltaproteobacteria bacterium]